MWYDMSGVKIIFFTGAMLALVGLGLYLMDHDLAGAALMCIGAAMMMIGFTITKFHLLVNFRKR